MVFFRRPARPAVAALAADTRLFGQRRMFGRRTCILWAVACLAGLVRAAKHSLAFACLGWGLLYVTDLHGRDDVYVAVRGTP